MTKIKRIIAHIMLKINSIKKIISENWYVKSMNKYLKFIGCDLEEHVKFIASDVKIDLTDPSKIHIGKNSVITSKVTILVHDYSIECGLVSINKQDDVFEKVMIRDVRIGRNCFIGQNSFIKPGTIIGDNCIVGAGSVVSGKIPANSIVIGNPSQIIANTQTWANKKMIDNAYVNGNKRKKWVKYD